MSIATDPVAHAVRTILVRGIDKTVLELAYGGLRLDGTRKNVGEELDRSICKGVCDELNLLSGDEYDIKLSDCKLITSQKNKIYYVPEKARKGRTILEVLSLKRNLPGSGGGLGGFGGAGAGITTAMSTMLNNMTPGKIEGNINVELVDNNMFRIATPVGSVNTYDLITVELENRDRLRRIKKGSYPLFAKLAKLHIQSEIYSNRIVLQKASLHGGHELSEISEVINEFSGSSEEYDTLMYEQGAKMLNFADESFLNNLDEKKIR